MTGIYAGIDHGNYHAFAGRNLVRSSSQNFPFLWAMPKNLLAMKLWLILLKVVSGMQKLCFRV